MKTFLTSAIIAIIASLGTYHFTSGENENTVQAKESAYERVMSSNTLRCGYAIWPPYALTKDANTGKISGLMHDLTEKVASNLDLKVEWIETNWGTAIEDMKNDRFDAFCTGFWRSAKRGKHVLFGEPVFFNVVNMYVSEDFEEMENPFIQLNSKEFTLAVLDGEMSSIIANNHFSKASQYAVTQTGNISELMLAITTGKANATFVDPGVAIKYNENNKNKVKKASNLPFQSFPASYAFNLDEPQLKSMIDSAIIELAGQGIIEQMMRAHEPSGEVFLPVANAYKAQ